MRSNSREYDFEKWEATRVIFLRKKIEEAIREIDGKQFRCIEKHTMVKNGTQQTIGLLPHSVESKIVVEITVK